jgi:Tfp pilus assembly protein PilF
MNRRARRGAAKQQRDRNDGGGPAAVQAAIAARRWPEAEALLRHALAARPGDAALHNDLGNLARLQGRLDEAETHYRAAIAASPGRADALSNLGATLMARGRFAEALAACQQAAALQPGLAAAFGNAGVALRELGRLAEAEDAQRRALALRPDHAETLANLGVLLRDQGRLAEAIAAFDAAIARTPTNALARKNRALAHLAAEHLAQGWADHAWRWRSPDFDSPRRDRGLPEWTGGRAHVLAWGEQGIGDRILLAAMLSDLLAAAGDVTLEAEPRLAPLLARAFPALTIVPEGDPPAAATATHQIALGALGQHFRASLDAFPQRRAYLQADPSRRAALRQRYAGGPNTLLVGLSWRSANAAFGRFKSATLADWAPILNGPGITFVNLQYGDTAAERAGTPLVHDATIDPLRDLDGFAAQVAAMDLVITTSNTTAHMAGALGVETWTLLPAGPGLLWYWFQGRDDSPWYPSMRLFRQTAPGNWAELIAAVAAQLRRR